jgi:hypothetical protein
MPEHASGPYVAAAPASIPRILQPQTSKRLQVRAYGWWAIVAAAPASTPWILQP